MGRVTVGDVLDGRYELLERLGQGGFGVVWRAFDTRMRRQVAVKVIGHHGGDQQKAALRFVREACAAGNLSHPHIVTVHDLGEGELGGRQVTYLVMELLTGRTLTAVLRAACPTRCRACAGGGRSAPRWPPPTTPAWCTGTSSPTTSWSPRPAR